MLIRSLTYVWLCSITQVAHILLFVKACHLLLYVKMCKNKRWNEECCRGPVDDNFNFVFHVMVKCKLVLATVRHLQYFDCEVKWHHMFPNQVKLVYTTGLIGIDKSVILCYLYNNWHLWASSKGWCFIVVHVKIK